MRAPTQRLMRWRYGAVQLSRRPAGNRAESALECYLGPRSDRSVTERVFRASPPDTSRLRPLLAQPPVGPDRHLRDTGGCAFAARSGTPPCRPAPPCAAPSAQEGLLVVDALVSSNNAGTLSSFVDPYGLVRGSLWNGGSVVTPHASSGYKLFQAKGGRLTGPQLASR